MVVRRKSLDVCDAAFRVGRGVPSLFIHLFTAIHRIVPVLVVPVSGPNTLAVEPVEKLHPK